MIRTAIRTHHVILQALKDNKLIQLLGGVEFIESSLNKLHLTSNIDIARITATPLHSGPHPWILNAQRNLLNGFLSRSFCNYGDTLLNPQTRACLQGGDTQ